MPYQWFNIQGVLLSGSILILQVVLLTCYVFILTFYELAFLLFSHHNFNQTVLNSIIWMCWPVSSIQKDYTM